MSTLAGLRNSITLPPSLQRKEEKDGVSKTERERAAWLFGERAIAPQKGGGGGEVGREKEREERVTVVAAKPELKSSWVLHVVPNVTLRVCPAQVSPPNIHAPKEGRRRLF